MQRFKLISNWTVFITILLIGDLSWRGWNVYRNAAFGSIAGQFKFEVLRTNNITGIGLFNVKTDEPVWTRFGDNETAVTENYFFKGKEVFDVTARSNKFPIYNVYFRSPNKSVTWWLNRGGSETFNERIFYDTSGNFLRHEIWYAEAWHTVDRRNDKNGIMVNDRWCPLGFDTNGMWMIETR
jgi:hypothetical protein